jgi:Flp pilus assembly protein TadG
MLRLLSRFRRAKDGLAAIEFGMLLPVMVTMFLGGVEVTDALACKQKVTGLASTAADMVAQAKAMTTSDLSNVFAADTAIVYPYPECSSANTCLKITISSLVDNGAGGAKVAWSCTRYGTARAVNSVVTVPTGVILSGGSVILAEVSYPYKSKVSDFLVGTTTMTSNFYSRPRRSTTVTAPSSCPAPPS